MQKKYIFSMPNYLFDVTGWSSLLSKYILVTIYCAINQLQNLNHSRVIYYAISKFFTLIDCAQEQAVPFHVNLCPLTNTTFSNY